MQLRLPPVDDIRSPFVVPIGHLSMQASRFELSLLHFLAELPADGSPLQTNTKEVATQIRYWDKKAEKYVDDRINLITDPDIRDKAKLAMQTFSRLREDRNRVIHDAIEPIIYENEGGYGLRAAALEHRRENRGSTSFRIRDVTPEEIANLAYEFYDLRQELDGIGFTLNPPNLD